MSSSICAFYTVTIIITVIVIMVILFINFYGNHFGTATLLNYYHIKFGFSVLKPSFPLELKYPSITIFGIETLILSYLVVNPCPLFQVCPRTSLSQTPCQDGDYCPAGSTAPENCTEHFYCPNAAKKISCPPGKLCPARSSVSSWVPYPPFSPPPV